MNTVETTQKRFVCENPKCQKEHDGLYGSGRFCSKHCRMVWIGMKSNQTMKEHGTKKCNFKNTDKKRAPYGTWKCQYCELVFETRAKLGEHKHLNHKEKCGKSHSAWNKGLTKETSPIIQKSVETFQHSISSGKYIPVHHKVSKATKERLSEIRSQQLDDSKAGFKDVKWYKVKNLDGKEFTVRGHWEENVAKRLNDLGLLWIKNQRIKYVDDKGIRRTYNPDFYIPSLKRYVEVKGYYSDKDKRKMKFVLTQNTVEIYFIDSKVYQDFVCSKIDLSDSLLIKI